VGVILHDGDAAASELLAAFAAELRGEGVDVGGLVQQDGVDAAGRPRMELVDVRTGQVFCISLDLGPGSDACSLDASGLAEASSVLRREIAAGVALLVVNKFSSREAEGEGLAAEMFEAIAGGIPLLTTLSGRHRERWDEMTGGVGVLLPPDPAALRAWWRSVAA
jgi:hypothetical protein